MSRYLEVRERVLGAPRTWLVTGCAGFIGSNLAELLLSLGQEVVGLDNFSTGFRHNLDDVRASVGVRAASRFRFVEGDIRNLDVCRDACRGVDYVLHQAALGSVPRSIDDPIATNASNVDGFLNVLVAARDAGVARMVYATSSSTYGDDPTLPKREDVIGRPLSPYAVSKYVNELYAGVFQRAYGLEAVGLRYFNVYGRRQNPEGAYAAVIPRWTESLLSGGRCTIHGDGSASRDFCYVDNVLQANLLAATVEDADAVGQVYNVACGARTTLNQLFATIRGAVAAYRPEAAFAEPEYGPRRPGDIPHSHADISRIRERLEYEPDTDVAGRLRDTVAWFAGARAGAPASSAA